MLQNEFRKNQSVSSRENDFLKVLTGLVLRTGFAF